MKNRAKNQGKHRNGDMNKKLPEWDAIREVSKEVANSINGLVKQARTIGQICLTPRVREEVLGEESYKRIETGVGTLAKDLVAISEDYRTIAKKHERRHGFAKDDDDQMKLLALGIEYDELRQHLTSSSFTTATEIMLEFSERIEDPAVASVIKEIDELRKQAKKVENLGDKND